ncbi:MAG: hypothetical protein Tsb0013_01560 [Phycisphaerales bacterium]
MAHARLITSFLLASALLGACTGDAPEPSPTPAGAGQPDNPLLAMTDTARVTVGGERFTVALALDQDTRVKGLGDVPEIPPDRGMLFVFPTDQYLSFVMRDCKVDIDIAYLTEKGRIGRIHTMKMDPRQEGEGDFAYEMRLERYPSGFPARMALELRAGTLERLGVSVGDVVEIEDLEALKGRAE